MCDKNNGAGYITLEDIKRLAEKLPRFNRYPTPKLCGECSKVLTEEEVYPIMGFAFCKEHAEKIRKGLEECQKS